jgi:Secretion system C-terminal sorting domain
MKKIILIFILLFGVIVTNAQWINSISVYPSNPTSSDQIKVLVNINFSSGSCDAHTQSHSNSGNTIYATALHCLGPLTFICNHTDTFTIGQLATGNYSFIFNVNEGFGPSPCSPGIVPGPTDTFNFFVSNPTFVKQLKKDQLTVNYNSLSKIISIKSVKNEDNTQIELLSIEGKHLALYSFHNNSFSIDASELKAGMYFIRITNSEGILTKKILIPASF